MMQIPARILTHDGKNVWEGFLEDIAPAVRISYSTIIPEDTIMDASPTLKKVEARLSLQLGPEDGGPLLIYKLPAGI